MGVNSLPTTDTRQRRGCNLNLGPSAPESSTLTTRLPSRATPARDYKYAYSKDGEVNATSIIFIPLRRYRVRSNVMSVSVCLCVCLSFREPVCAAVHARYGLCVLPSAVAQSSPGGVAIPYVLPVLWMTSNSRISQGSSTWPPG